MSPPGNRYQQVGLLIVPDVASLRALNSPATGNGMPVMFLQGRLIPYDGYEGFFEWSPDSTANDDGFNVISSNWEPVSGRWLRLDSFLASTSYRTTTGTPVNLLITDYVLLVDATAGTVTLNLLAAATVPGRSFRIKKIDSTFNPVNVTRAGSDTIDGQTVYSMFQQYQSVDIFSNATNWWTF